MAKITEVSLGLERKVGLPNYSSLTFSAWAKAVLDEGEGAKFAFKDLAVALSAALDEEQEAAGAARPGVTVVEKILGRKVQ